MIFAGLVYPERWYTEGLRVMTTTYPIKAPLYAITKATNYLPNVLMQMEAKEAGFDNGVFIDEDGNVGESSNMNVAFVTKQGVLVHPKFDHILSGCTSLRLLELARAHQDRVRVAGVEVRDIPVAEARASREMLLLGSSIKVAPVIQWDDQVIGDGKPGPVSKALLAAARGRHAAQRPAHRHSLLSFGTDSAEGRTGGNRHRMRTPRKPRCACRAAHHGRRRADDFVAGRLLRGAGQPWSSRHPLRQS